MSLGVLPMPVDTHRFADPALPPRFWVKVLADPQGCWLWQGSILPNGYGQFSYEGTTLAHRAAYGALVGPIPESLVIDHVCRVRSCVNPRHLRAVTQSENILSGELVYLNIERGRSKTHCAQGHEFSEENTRRTATGRRVCRACASKWDKAKRERQKSGDIRPPGRPKQ